MNSGGDVTKCRVKINGDYVSSAQKNAFYDAVYHWNNMDDLFGYINDKVYIYEVDFDSSKCDMMTASYSTYGGWFLGDEYSNLYAVTCHKSETGTWLINQNTGEEGTFTSGGKISYYRIFLKSFATTGSAYPFGQYVMRHEIGHVLGMGHYMGNSIMYPYSSSSVQIYQLMTYDYQTLQQFYPNP